MPPRRPTSDDRGRARARAGGERDRGRARDGRGGRPPGKPAAFVRRVADGGAVKVNDAAARGIHNGHPWVFRDSVLRMPDQLAAGACVRVADADGGPLGWGLVEPEGAIALRIVSRQETFAWDEAAITARVKAAVEHRRRHLPGADGPLATAVRLVHGEGDGLPGLAVDRLGDFLLVYKYSRGAEGWLDTLVKVLEAELAPAGIYMQDRLRPVTAEDRRPPAFHLAGKTAPTEYEVEEDGLKFVVDVTAPVSPGLFLDLREGRRMCESVAKDRRVLNLFSFTGAFGIRAVRGGASEVFNVDAAARSHARCRQNLIASGFDPQACKPLDGDVFKHLERLRFRKETFDLVVVDPPPFSRVGGKVFSALRQWSDLVRAIVQVVAPGGLVLAVSNASRLPEEELLLAIGEGATLGGRDAAVIGECSVPPDFPVPPAFPEGRYLKVKLLAIP
jgi:23S rRNA (cytosine1962-C5)-methyltransferase